MGTTFLFDILVTFEIVVDMDMVDRLYVLSR